MKAHGLTIHKILASFIAMLCSIALTSQENFAFIPVPNPAVEKISLVFAGDIMVHNQNFQYEPFSEMYEPVRPIIQSADLAFGNLEFPVDDDLPFSGYPLFNAHKNYVQAAIDAGFSVFTLANNHSADQGKDGVRSTQAALGELQENNYAQGKTVWFSGLRIAEDAQTLTAPQYRMTVIEQKGWRIGFVALTEFSNEYRGAPLVQILNWQNEKRLEDFLEWVKGQRSQVDLMVLAMHWGVEYQLTPSKGQVAAAKKMVDAGVDIFWGHHPHVLQPWYALESPRGHAVVMPSLGNFVSAQAWYLYASLSEDNRAYKGDSSLFRLEISRDEGGKIQICETEPILIAHRRMPEGNIKVFPYRDLIQIEDKEWGEYFRTRFGILSNFYPGSHDVSLFFDGRDQERLRNIPESLW